MTLARLFAAGQGVIWREQAWSRGLGQVLHEHDLHGCHSWNKYRDSCRRYRDSSP